MLDALLEKQPHTVSHYWTIMLMKCLLTCLPLAVITIMSWYNRAHQLISCQLTRVEHALLVSGGRERLALFCASRQKLQGIFRQILIEFPVAVQSLFLHTVRFSSLLSSKLLLSSIFHSTNRSVPSCINLNTSTNAHFYFSTLPRKHMIQRETYWGTLKCNWLRLWFHYTKLCA